jgi:hypothetical protein
MTIISVEMTEEEIRERLVEESRGITNGAYSGYMCMQHENNDLRFTPVASMGGACTHIARALPGELWTDAGFGLYLMSLLMRTGLPCTAHIRNFPNKKAAQDAFRRRKRKLSEQPQ